MADAQKISTSQDVRKNTRETILLAAERLFAEEGIDTVSIRQVNLASGQKNSSAAQYHFGTKGGLVEGIFDLRMEAINDRRAVILSQLMTAGRETDMHALVGAVVIPLAELITAKGEASYYLGFVAQVNDHPQYDHISRERGQQKGDAFEKILYLMKSTLSDLPDNIFLMRFGTMLRQVFSELAAIQRQVLATGHQDQKSTELYICNLIDTLSAALMAPISDDTKNRLAIKGQ